MSHYSLGALYMNQQNWEEAIVQARSAIKADPTLAITHAMLGAALQKTGDIAGARAALTEAVRLDPKSPQWKALLAKLPPPLPVAPPPRERK
jgi:cytochrome c-type biogenesis protein CcmH/NrfG